MSERLHVYLCPQGLIGGYGPYTHLVWLEVFICVCVCMSVSLDFNTNLFHVAKIHSFAEPPKKKHNRKHTKQMF